MMPETGEIWEWHGRKDPLLLLNLIRVGEYEKNSKEFLCLNLTTDETYTMVFSCDISYGWRQLA
jgi:hypothetical protein